MSAAVATATRRDRFTLPEMAREVGISESRASYIVLKHRIDPIERLGYYRIFGLAELERVRAVVEASRRRLVTAD
jgi:hypothetical protein